MGRATARAFGEESAQIGLIARARAGLEGARREVEACGGRGLILPVFSPVKETTAEEFKRVTEVTYLGYVYGTLAALRRMLPRDRGLIIQVGSALAHRGIPLQAAYCASKHAIQGLCDSLRCELLHDHSKVQVTMLQMPALNTPQFDWVKSRLPHRAQPVPAIFEPEVAAEAILYASHHPRREFYVGWPAVQAIVGNKIAPGLLDHYLARTCVDAQQTNEKENPDRPNNLWEPVDAEKDHGAHGRLQKRSRPASTQVWASQHRGWLAAGLALAAAAGAILWAAKISATKPPRDELPLTHASLRFIRGQIPYRKLSHSFRTAAARC